MTRNRLGVASLLSLAVWGLWLTGPVWSQGRGQGFRPCPYTAYQCPVAHTCTVFDAAGKITRVFTETLADGMYPGMALLLDTETRGQVHVHLGPVWYLERQEFELKPGEVVRLKDMCEKAGDRLRVVAYELRRGDYVLHLRDDKGRPNWEAWRKQ